MSLVMIRGVCLGSDCNRFFLAFIQQIKRFKPIFCLDLPDRNAMASIRFKLLISKNQFLVQDKNNTYKKSQIQNSNGRFLWTFKIKLNEFDLYFYFKKENYLFQKPRGHDLICMKDIYKKELNCCTQIFKTRKYLYERNQSPDFLLTELVGLGRHHLKELKKITITFSIFISVP